MPPINLPTTPPTFPEYQLIHQTQQRQRYPELADQPRPAASNPWKRTVLFCLGLTSAAFSLYALRQGIVMYVLLLVIFTPLGLLHQRRKYRRAFREFQAQPRPLSFRVSETGLAVQWPQGWQRLPWYNLTRVQQVGDWLLLYPGPDFCYYLDLRRVPAPYTPVDVLALIGKREESGSAATFAP
ncbi:hypothetical protein [Hymenobacter perfusus]|uniref:YcxB family protein n=1 Tax=Hymenobacter perfusus TaxID=1236770 RepID=A0A3R9MHM4_9BACT|nr:hypothetical protein [Hymenobacter perfusus]RSK42421.1 hypothetical protein EI293_16020 [Hymenobacter perfusus]